MSIGRTIEAGCPLPVRGVAPISPAFHLRRRRPKSGALQGRGVSSEVRWEPPSWVTGGAGARRIRRGPGTARGLTLCLWSGGVACGDSCCRIWLPGTWRLQMRRHSEVWVRRSSCDDQGRPTDSLRCPTVGPSLPGATTPRRSPRSIPPLARDESHALQRRNRLPRWVRVRGRCPRARARLASLRRAPRASLPAAPPARGHAGGVRTSSWLLAR